MVKILIVAMHWCGNGVGDSYDKICHTKVVIFRWSISFPTFTTTATVGT